VANVLLDQNTCRLDVSAPEIITARTKCNKLECLSLTGLSFQIQCLWVMQGHYPRVEHMKAASLG
jgi:hypothetical protein